MCKENWKIQVFQLSLLQPQTSVITELLNGFLGRLKFSFQSLHSDKSCVWYVESQSDYEQRWPLSGVKAGEAANYAEA